MTIRDNFVARFGEEQAAAIEQAADMHKDWRSGNEKGSDPFRFAVVICIGFECMSKDSYREYHGITAPWADLHQWIKDHGDLAHHDGDCDYLTLFAGGYSEYMPKPPAVPAA